MTRIVLLAAWLAAEASGAVLDGRVVADHSGAPVAGAELRVMRPNVRTVVAEVETDGEGRFHIPDLLDGEYRVEVSKAVHVPASIRVRAAARPNPLEIRLVRFGVISGHVLDAAAHPIASALVRVMAKAQPSAPFQTWGNPIAVDERGEYRIFNLPPGQYAIATTAPGVLYYPNNTQPHIFTVAGGEEYSRIDFSVLAEPRYKVSGTVAGLKPNTVANVTLVPAEQPALPVATVRTNSSGAFHLDEVGSGSYTLLASAPVEGYGGMYVILGADRVFGRVPVQVLGHEVEGVAVTVAEPKAAMFIVAGGEGGECPDTAMVSLSPVEAWGAFLTQTAQATLSKPAPVKNLAPGKYSVTVSPAGETCYNASGTMVFDTSAETKPIRLRVAPAGSVRGKLLSPAGPPSGFAVVLLSADDDKAPAQVAYPDAEGAFAFTPLRPGRYRIAARPGQSVRWVADVARMIEINVPGGTPTEIELPAPAGGEK